MQKVADPERSRRGFIVPALIVTVVVLIAGGLLGAFYFGKKSSGPTATNPVVQQEAQPSLDETSNWKTYQGNDFSFKYPMDWTIEESSSQITIKGTEHLEAAGSSPEQDYVHRITVSIIDTPSSSSLKEILEKIYSDWGPLLPLIMGSAKETKINDKDALEFEIPGAGGFFTEGILITSINTAYHIEALGLRDTSIGLPEVYRAILSTFKFTN